jgi:hypothetical protein
MMLTRVFIVSRAALVATQKENKCLESQSVYEGASIDAVDCNGAAMEVQDWAFCSDGTIRNGGINNGVADFGSGMCLAANSEVHAAGSVWARDFHLGKCDSTDAKLMMWDAVNHDGHAAPECPNIDSPVLTPTPTTCIDTNNGKWRGTVGVR